MKGVKFGSYYSWDDWKLVLQAQDVSIPAPKTNTIDIPGANGSLDLTEALTGSVVYEDRELSFSFQTAEALTQKGWADMISEITTAIHGQRLGIVLDDDPEWTYNGRCTIDSFTNTSASQSITILCKCNPLKTDASGNTSL